MAQMKAFRVSDAIVDMIDTLAKQRETTATAVVKQAVRTESMIQQRISSGERIFTRGKNGTMTELVFMHMED